MTDCLIHSCFYSWCSNVPFAAITSALFVKELPDRETIVKTVSKNLLFYKRFRSIPQGNFWTEVAVDVDRHIIFLEVENHKTLETQLEAIMNQEIPKDKPRWEVGPLLYTCQHGAI